jgi:hypothetical protein
LTLGEGVKQEAGPDGKRKHRFLQVAIGHTNGSEAIAWTYDVPANEYASERRT